MSSKSYDVYIDSGISVRIPTGTDPDTPEGYKILEDLATKKFVEILLSDKVDFTYKHLDAEDKMNTDPWPKIPHAVPHTLPMLTQSKETVASVNAFLLKMTLEIAQENINCIKNGNRQDLTFDAQLGIVKKIAKFFNPAWK